MSRRKPRALRIPAEFKLLGHTIPVSFNDFTTMEDMSVDDFGAFDDDGYYITINKTVEGSAIAEETYCHELVEAMNEVMELGLKHDTIQRLGAGLHQILTTSYYPRRKKDDST